MTLVRALALMSGTALSLSLACSDPPAPPAQGAVSIQVNPGGGACSAAGSPITAPPGPAGMPDAVSNALGCSLANAGCDPHAYVLVDGDSGTSIACTVTPSGDGFDFSAALLSGTRMSFRASGHVTGSGGAVQLTESGANTSGSGLQDGACEIHIDPNVGTVKKGAIWARFHCTNFTDPNAAGGQQCVADGAFIFENCGS